MNLSPVCLLCILQVPRCKTQTLCQLNTKHHSPETKSKAKKRRNKNGGYKICPKCKQTVNNNMYQNENILQLKPNGKLKYQ